MSEKEYLGYPEYVVITLPKCGTKTMNKCFSSLGYKGKQIFGNKLSKGNLFNNLTGTRVHQFNMCASNCMLH